MKKYIVFTSLLLVFSLNVYAVNGFINHGIGTKSKGMAGAGVALAEDVLSGGLNPANMVYQGTRLDIGASLFAVDRGFTAYDDADPAAEAVYGKVNPGNYDSKYPVFLIPQFGFNYQIDEKSSIGVVTVLGGGNSKYSSAAFDGFLGTTSEDNNQPVGTDFFQLYVHIPYSRLITDNLSVGVAPILAVETMRLVGLEAWEAVSSHPNEVTNKGMEFAFGYGASIGMHYEPTDWLSIGLSAQSRINMEKLDRYRGVIADDGNLDIPESFQVGAALEVTQSLTLLADFQKIYYSNVDATGNSNDWDDYTANLGSNNSSGPGWDDANVKKVGIRWQYNDKTVLRAGFSRTNEIEPDTFLLVNLLAPLVAEDHWSLGMTRQLKNGDELSASLTYSPRETPTGVNPVTGQHIDLFLEQLEFEVTYGRRF
uniref:Long-chain fatty acid transport protein n=1 Tax=Candidatus Kentrum sp. FM TaxID=2126340 RepID=A0A450WK49_9GAMM|nr:MAG: long-chain fatty acid transport protein [Candidatus Kentron sp. FM]VFJ54148.1 MAG: long-chain fatty acid transport protein [Candidatus Kentron sp. FM]VFK17412.1 MAG: long-chain fatty acid transport protein [Candidatus Kentron sp. FM]